MYSSLDRQHHLILLFMTHHLEYGKADSLVIIGHGIWEIILDKPHFLVIGLSMNRNIVQINPYTLFPQRLKNLTMSRRNFF
ncbi:hypothetical protein AN449_03875 [Pseudomonas aeruginosa]|nr:hypothetical protein AU380_16325 [Pseudomonas aeruginosa]KRU62369.1 hypothetical protein AN450_21015 [Pseudomonas aeruginosa]KRU62437.1 hypothetical protein AN449_03875 [Pseudomonas aeruginosa]OHQ53604.1 hypothetical protein HMPREF2615_07190 [Pseudomonas aeruginosa]WPB09322.1 hypothetical protein [Cloning vector pMA11O8]